MFQGGEKKNQYGFYDRKVVSWPLVVMYVQYLILKYDEIEISI